MCEHLLPIEQELHRLEIKETYRGQAWGGVREWIYFDCYLDFDKLKSRFHLPDFVVHQSNDDNKSGLEDGLVCEKCNDAIMGYHRTLDIRRPDDIAATFTLT